jgi:hypothetical protein
MEETIWLDLNNVNSICGSPNPKFPARHSSTAVSPSVMYFRNVTPTVEEGLLYICKTKAFFHVFMNAHESVTDNEQPYA